uniref:Uncharacterized protein n=1 Tax=Solanum lycopersicum TaxID=4081 RepID=A0A3Q7IQU1_SOLLC
MDVSDRLISNQSLNSQKQDSLRTLYL